MDWQAKWIWARGHSDTPNFYMYARKEIEIVSAPSATAYVTCSTEYKLYVNGRYVGRGPSPCHPSFQYYDEYELTRFLRPGKNVIAAICYNYGVGTHCRPEAPGAFLLQVEIGNGNGSPTVIFTDETWRVKPADDWDFDSTRMFWTVGFQEVYDSRKKPVGWNVVGFDDGDWREPLVVGEVGVEPWITLVARQIPLLREVEAYPSQVMRCGVVTPIDEPDLDIATLMYREPKETNSDTVKYANALLNGQADAALISPHSDVFVTLDFGQEVVGFPVIKLRDGGAGVIDVGYSEALDENGEVYPTRQTILQADRLVAHGGRQEWQTFGRRAFRYMQLTFKGFDGPVEVESVTINRVGYPVELVSSFECSDDLLNDIWRVGVDTLRIGMQDAYEDCPLREHGQYPGDARVQALLNYYSFLDSKLAAKALWQFVQCQREDGLFNALWPSSTNHILPDYNLVWVMMLHDYHLYTGDRELVQQLYPNMRLLLENWARTQESENGLLVWHRNSDIEMHEWWLFIDHAKLHKRGEVAAYNAFYFQALRDASKLAQAINEFDDMKMWHARADVVRKAFNDRFWSEEKGAYIDCNDDGKMSEIVSTQANTLAVLFGLSDSKKGDRIRHYLTSDQPRIPSSGPYFNFYVLQAMARLGMDQEALDLIRSDWGGMLQRGATTWWECFNPTWEESDICPDSLCHAWSGAPTYFLPAEVLGVKPSMPESPVVLIQPRPGDLAWAKGHIKTHAAEVDVEWHSEPGYFTIDINAPEGFILGLPVTGFSNPSIEEIDLSPDTPERRARKTYGWTGIIWRDGEERDPYMDWLHRQEAEPPCDYAAHSRCTVAEGYIWVRDSSFRQVRYEIRDFPV